MERITVETPVPYDVLIAPGLLNQAGALCARVLAGRRVMIASDDRVAPLYLERAAESFRGAGFQTASFVFPHGEEDKSLATVERLLIAADAAGLTRQDCFAALGGGVTGDLTGLAAALYLRGVDYVQLPTTLLAMADASVGGKTAVNLPGGKNLCGAFYQPRLVVMDPDLLRSLPPEIFAEGMAEVIKHGAICSPGLLDRLEAGADLASVLAENVRIKSDIVIRDEREGGLRQLLNLGHTFGHALEKLSGFSIYHGEGVAVGLLIAAYTAEWHGLCEAGVYDELRRLLAERGLPVTTAHKAAEVAEAAMNDKKRRGDTLTLVLPERRGSSRLYPVPARDLAGLTACCDGEVTGR